MRFVMIALIALSLPLAYAFLSQNPQRRPMALAAIGTIFFLAGDIRLEAFVYGWPAWEGTIKGFAISPADTIALALLMTRSGRSAAPPFLGWFAFYGFLLILSVFPSQVPVAALFSVWQYARVVLLFVVFALEAGRPETRAGLFTGLSLGLMIQAGFVVVQKLSGVMQPPGTMPHQNTLGLAVEAALIPLLGALLAGDRRNFTKAGVLAGFVIVALIGSRGTLGFAVGGALALLVLSAMRGMTPVKKRMLGLAVVGAVLTAPLAYITMSKRFAGSTVFYEENERTALENAARAMASDHLLGVGANHFVLINNTAGYASKAGVNWSQSNRARPAHNAYLLARAETGWAGEIAVILLLFVPLIAGFRLAFTKQSGLAGEAALASATTLAVVMLHNNYEFAFFTYNVLALCAMNIGIVAAQVMAHRATAKRRPQPNAPRRMARPMAFGPPAPDMSPPHGA